ncbi:MAG TPA: DEAD/DEAH box helicase [Rhodocyclaceae bacterium]|nr:DEAD/DEAH box helicase [Rhodocyclaceae bacterium]
MTIFDLHSAVLADYRDFVASFIQVADPRLQAFVERALAEEAHLWPDPLLQVSPSYRREQSVDDLAAAGVIHPQTARIFRRADGDPFHLYQHQLTALHKARRRESYVVTSGTGSGKSLTYFLPIVDALLRQPAGPRTVALVVYPMNALVNSQEQALKTLKTQYERRTGQPFPVTFARYTGETRDEARQLMRQSPPHLVLTNYVMLELMLVRPEDQRFLDRSAGGIGFLVFDELHTYRGRQGADVAMLIRRLKERCAAPDLIHIGTSATMVANRQATPAERRQTVATFAARLFGHPFAAADVIEETLVPFTQGGFPSDDELRAALAAESGRVGERESGRTGEGESGRTGDLSRSQALTLSTSHPLPLFQQHPLSRWIEHTFGIEPEGEGGYRRRPPITLPAAAEKLAAATGLDVPTCQQRLAEWLALGGALSRDDGGRAFAFKLHQFISQGRAVYATLEPADQRAFSLDGQVQGREGRIQAPLKFCRQCGQEYYHVLGASGRFAPHPLGYAEPEEGQQGGYLMLAAEANDWSEEHLPEEWRDARGRLKPAYRDRVPQPVWVAPNGEFFSGPRPGAVKMWHQLEPFALCLSCGEHYTRREDEFRKLASLSSEARSSATTVLATALLRHAGRLGAARDKLLTFTDNRQDASLQAGHFNDFVHLSVLRAALVAALDAHGELSPDRVAQETTARCGLTLRDIARNAELDPTSAAAREAWSAFTELTEYRLLEDLRRGWRVVQPNLEELGLLRIAYRGLEELAADEAAWRFSPALATRTPAERSVLVRALLNQFRRKLALNASLLQEQAQGQLRRRSEQHLNEFWGLDPDGSELSAANCFVLLGASSRAVEGFSLGAQSAIGRFLRRQLDLSTADYPPFIAALLALLVSQGLLERLPALDDHQRFQLNLASVIWQRGDGAPPPVDPMYARRSASAAYVDARRPANAFFQRFYRETAAELAQLEAREHTAQVVAPGERERRERRFRWEAGDQDKERDLGRRLPYLVCSPTMELGVDIADLDIVHLRNVPPTPANYAQRSGRAGRQGQAGLIFTYSGALNSHDQYFFHHREEMVAGAVRPPQLDLANESLARAHVHAMWLAEVRLPLGQSIEEVVDTVQEETLPLRENPAAQIQLSASRQQQLAERVRRALAGDRDVLTAARWYSDRWLEQVIAEAPQAFDRAFDRWRELYRTATRELREAQAALLRARRADEQQEANRRQQEALRQRNLLLQIETQREESDFYPYRYLASEGFLPGYNFPALPVRAWAPRGQGEFIARPRFLALREFAPNNIVYHEGAKWEVVAFQAPPGGLDERRSRRRLCYTCGAYCDAGFDLCPACQTRFDAENSLIAELLDMPNVRLRRRERITSDEEERRRRGYAIETFYQFAADEDRFRVRRADVVVAGEPLFHLFYAPSATILGVNHGWRAARTPGFTVDFERGEIVNPEASTPSRPTPRPQRLETVRLAVQETQNLLLVRPAQPELFADPVVATTLEYALQRGLEEVFQLEENEIASGRIGRDAWRAMLFYETSEGGSGVLRRLIEEKDAFARLAASALARCHYTVDGEDRKPDCIAACYECLMSYSNQLDALLLNRRRIVPLLSVLRDSRVLARYGDRTWREQLAWLRALTDPRSELERRLLDALAAAELRLPDDAQRGIAEPRGVADFFYAPNICVFCDGAVHDQPDQRRQDEVLRAELRARGYEVVVIRDDRDLPSQIAGHPAVFGG